MSVSLCGVKEGLDFLCLVLNVMIQTRSANWSELCGDDAAKEPKMRKSTFAYSTRVMTHHPIAIQESHLQQPSIQNRNKCPFESHLPRLLDSPYKSLTDSFQSILLVPFL